MEEHNKETEKRKYIKPIIILVAIIVIVGLLVFFAIKYSENIKSFIANLKEQKNTTNLTFQTIKWYEYRAWKISIKKHKWIQYNNWVCVWR